MRRAKVPLEVVTQKVCASLCARMDPKTHRVRPSWLSLMRETGVCRQRIADAIRLLKQLGAIKVVDVPAPVGDGKRKDYYYEIVKTPIVNCKVLASRQ